MLLQCQSGNDCSYGGRDDNSLVLCTDAHLMRYLDSHQTSHSLLRPFNSHVCQDITAHNCINVLISERFIIELL